MDNQTFPPLVSPMDTGCVGPVPRTEPWHHGIMASWHHGIMFFDFRGYQVAGKRMKKLPPRKKKINRIPRIPPLKAKSHLT